VTADGDASARGPERAQDAAKDGCLARTVRAAERYPFARYERQIEVLDHAPLAKPPAETFDDENALLPGGFVARPSTGELDGLELDRSHVPP
jgi:hypothetical protein